MQRKVLELAAAQPAGAAEVRAGEGGGERGRLEACGPMVASWRRRKIWCCRPDGLPQRESGAQVVCVPPAGTPRALSRRVPLQAPASASASTGANGNGNGNGNGAHAGPTSGAPSTAAAAAPSTSSPPAAAAAVAAVASDPGSRTPLQDGMRRKLDEVRACACGACGRASMRGAARVRCARMAGVPRVRVCRLRVCACARTCACVCCFGTGLRGRSASARSPLLRSPLALPPMRLTATPKRPALAPFSYPCPRAAPAPFLHAGTAADAANHH